MNGIGIGCIEGFPSYSESVARRLGGIYDLINTVGLRHERLHRQLRTIEQLQLQRELKTNTETIENIQESAEIGFFLVLFPYYVSHFFGDIIEKLHLAQSVPLAAGFRLKIDVTLMMCSIIVGLAIAIYLRLRKKFTGTPPEGMSDTDARRRFNSYKWYLFLLAVLTPLLLSALLTYVSDYLNSGAEPL